MSCLLPDEVIDHLAGRLEADAAERIEDHVDRCDACRRLLGEVARASLGGRASHETLREGPALAHDRRYPAPGAVVGRYRIVRRLGAGGMGIVWLAQDPDLDREVAIKLVHPERTVGPEHRTRTLREAQAMAKVAHPNVVAIYDVGVHDDQIYFAMELVHGRTMAAWLADEPPLTEILRVFAAAADGLDAAHRAGLVHRDFKPHNVMVGDAGVVKVMDFGLARAVAIADPVGDVGGSPLKLLVTPLTGAGALVGTPAYMAPEQIRGAIVDARSDQFSFCVALYEALYRARPFGGDTATELLAAMEAGPPWADPPRAVPARVRRALKRGLAVRAEQRFPDMAALRAAIAPVRSRGVVVAAILTAAAAASVATVLIARHQAGPTCDGGDSELASAWDPTRRDQLAQAFTRTGSPLAPATTASVLALLDRYADAWRDSYREACEATRVRGTRSEVDLATRMQCLRTRRAELAAVLEVLTAADANVLRNATAIVGSLTSPVACADALAPAVVMPIDPAIHAEIVAVDAQLAAAVARLRAQQHDTARTQMKDALARAEQLAHKPLLARAQHRLGKLELVWRDLPAAAEHLTRAVEYAEEIGDHELRALAMIDLVELARHEGKLPDAQRWARYAEAALARVSPTHYALGMLELEVAKTLAARGDEAGAEAAFLRALELLASIYGAVSAEVATARAELGAFYANRSDPERAIVELHRSRAIATELFGARSLEVAHALELESFVRSQQGRGEDALALAEEMLAILRSHFGDDSEMVGGSYATVALAQSKLGRHDEAIANMTKSVEIGGKHRTPSDPLYAGKVGFLGYMLAEAERLDEAYAQLERAHDLMRAAIGNDHADVVTMLIAMGSVRARQARHADALALFERARAIVARIEQPDSATMADILTRIGAAHIDRGQPAAAVGVLESALAMRTSRRAPADTLAWTRFELARALGARSPGSVRALELARQARAEAVTAKDTERIAKIDAWLATRK